MPKLLHVIPSKQLHRVESDLNTLRANLDEREIGFCTTDKCAYIKIGDDLFPMGHGLPNPEGLSFLIGEKIEEGEGEEATVRSVYGWQPAEQETFSTPQTSELVLWTKIYGKGFAADIAFMDKYGRDIAEMLDYSNVFVAEYGETTFSAIADAVAGGKIVMLKKGNTGKFTPMSTWSSGGCTFVTPVDAYGAYHSYNVALDDTWTDVPVSIGEDTPTENSNKLLTSGGAYTALEEKANSTNITPGTFTKVSVNSQGVVTEGGPLEGSDIPDHSAEKLTEGYLNPDRLEDNSIPAEKLEIRKKLLIDGITMGATESLTDVVLHSIYTGDLNVLQLVNTTYTPISPSVQNLNVTQGSAYNIYLDTSDNGVSIELTLTTLSEYTIHTILKITATYPSTNYASLQLVWLDEMLQPHMVELQWGSELTEQTIYYLDVFIRRIGTNCVARVAVMPSDFRKNY